MIAVCSKCQREHLIGERQPGDAIHCTCGLSFRTPAFSPYLAAVLRCSACGGSLAAQQKECRYCGNLLKDFDSNRYCSRCYAFLQKDAKFCSCCGASAHLIDAIPEESELKCPRDGNNLKGIPLGSHHAEECSQCAGMWISTEMFEKVLQAERGKNEKLKPLETIGESRAVAVAKVEYLKCLECQQFMARRNYLKVSGVIIDTCLNHGIWLDKNELYHIVHFIRKGGLLESRVQEEKELERQVLQKKRIASLEKGAPKESDFFRSSTGYSDIPSAFDFAVGLAEIFGDLGSN